MSKIVSLAAAQPEARRLRVEDAFNVTPDLLACFGWTGIDLFELGPGGSVLPIASPGGRLGREARERLAGLAEAGRLLAGRTDLPELAGRIAESLVILLRERQFSDSEIADMLVECMTRRIADVFEQPLPPAFNRFREDLEVVVHLLQERENLAGCVVRRLHREWSLMHKSVNCGFLGLAVHLHIAGGRASFDRLVRGGIGFFLHDIGLTRIPSFIRTSKGTLSTSDWKRIRLHPTEGSQMLMKLGVREEDVLTMVLDHHERLDGTGYPRRLKAGAASPLGRLCAIIDSYSAMRLDRPYRQGQSVRGALGALLTDGRRYETALVLRLHEVLRDSIGTRPQAPAARAG